MDTIHLENTDLPLYLNCEDLKTRDVHSEIAHWHENIELILVNHGTILCHTAGDRFELHPGDVCFINRKQLHRIERPEGDLCQHHVLIVGTSLLAQNALVYEKYIRPMLEDPHFSHIRFAGNSSPAAEITRLASRIREVRTQQECGYELELIALVHQLGKQLYLAYCTAPQLPMDSNALVQKQMAEYIFTHYAEPLTLDDIASSGSVSRSQSSKLFKTYTGLSPIAFLNHHRLEVSLDLLRRTNDSVADIALQCGFSDQSYFHRLFLREYGETPLAYRKSGRKSA